MIASADHPDYRVMVARASCGASISGSNPVGPIEWGAFFH